MGGSSGTSGAVNSAPETVSKKLFDNAKKQLELREIKVRDGTPWDDAVGMLAEMHFKDTHGYQFSGTLTKPPRAVPGTRVSTVKKFCSVETNLGPGLSNKITTYLNDILIKEADVPAELRSTVVEDLSKQAMVLVNRPAKEKNEWGRDSYVQTFQRSRAQDSISGNNEAIHADLVFLYCNTEITSGSKTEQIFVIYYLAAYYAIVSDTEERRRQFLNQAIAKAVEVTRPPYTLRNATDLRNALESYCMEEFQKFFKYDYDGGKPPNSIKAFPAYSQWYPSPSSATGSGRVQWVKSLPVQYCSNVSRVSKDVAFDVLERLKKLLGNFVSTYPSSASGSWSFLPLPVDPEPKPGAPKTATSSAFNGYMCFFTEEATTNSDYDAALTYVLIMGVFYEAPSLFKTLDSDLFDRLIRVLPDIGRFDHRLSDLDTKQESTLTTLAKDNAKLLFSRQHKFEWGNRPRLPARSGETVCDGGVLELMLKSEDLLDGDDSIERAVRRLFDPDESLGPAKASAVGKLYDDLVDTIKDCYANAPRKPDQWQIRQGTSKLFHDNRRHSLKHYATYLYVNGTHGTANTDTHQFYLQYLGVITWKDDGE